jgi:hypothetical protein
MAKLTAVTEKVVGFGLARLSQHCNGPLRATNARKLADGKNKQMLTTIKILSSTILFDVDRLE